MWTVAVLFPRHVLQLCHIVGCNKQLLCLANTILQSRIFEVAKVACVIEEKPRRYYAALDIQMSVLILSKLLFNRTFVAKVACVLSGVPTRLLSCTRRCGVWVDVLDKSISLMPNSRCQLAERSMCHRGKTSFLLMQYHGQFVVEIASLFIWILLRNKRRPSLGASTF